MGTGHSGMTPSVTTLDLMTAAAMVSAGAASNPQWITPLMILITKDSPECTIGHLHGVAMFCRDVTRNTIHRDEVCGHYLQLTACDALNDLVREDPGFARPLAVCSAAVNNTTDLIDPTLLAAAHTALDHSDTLRDFLIYTLGVFGHMIHHATTGTAQVLCTGINREDSQ